MPTTSMEFSCVLSAVLMLSAAGLVGYVRGYRAAVRQIPRAIDETLKGPGGVQ